MWKQLHQSGFRRLIESCDLSEYIASPLQWLKVYKGDGNEEASLLRTDRKDRLAISRKCLIAQASSS